VGWVRRYLTAKGWRHPAELGRAEATAFLSDLATRARVSASTQNQALAALLFLHRAVLECDLPWLDELVRARHPRRVPTVLTRAEVARVLAQVDGTPRLVATLLHGAGLRLLEPLRLRIQDVDLQTRTLTIRSGKGDRDRRAILPEASRACIATAIERALAQHAHDLAAGAGWVELPSALHRKLRNAGRSARVFPATSIDRHPETGQRRRHHVHLTVIQRAMHTAVQRVDRRYRATCHTLRHSFATHLLEDGQDIGTIQELLGHRCLKTRMITTHVLNRGPLGVRSPLDRLPPRRGRVPRSAGVH
jgi:integron integrase